MGHDGDWSPDEPLGTEVFDAWDESLDAEDAADPEALERSEGERSIDRQLFVDELELDEAGVRLDDPERIVVLAGGADDPDGLDTPPWPANSRPGEEGWDLDAGEEGVTDPWQPQ